MSDTVNLFGLYSSQHSETNVASTIPRNGVETRIAFALVANACQANSAMTYVFYTWILRGRNERLSTRVECGMWLRRTMAQASKPAT